MIQSKFQNLEYGIIMLLPQDILPLMVLFKKSQRKPLHQASLATRLNWSASALHRSLSRLNDSKLWNKSSNRVDHHATINFLRYGMPHVFPAKIKTLCRGMMTAQLPEIAQPEIPFVWPDESSSTMGIGVQPLDAGFVYLSHNKPELKSWLDLVEVFRLGRIREIASAVQVMEKEYASRTA
jgi:hypothetical protein